MERKRYVDKLLSVFDLTIGQAQGLSESLKTRVIFEYDRRTNKREFRLLDRDIPAAQGQQIRAWLEEHIDLCDMESGLSSNEIDADALH